ncbi:MAG: NAD-dependent epimerase/dehydratase family protein [Ignavibacteria bacterium]
MNILVTGGAGFIGSHIVDTYIQAGHNVIVIDNLSRGSLDNLHPEATFIKANITDNLETLFSDYKIDIINHQAAQIDLNYSIKNPIHSAQENILGTINLLQFAAKHGIKKFIFASSGGAIYGENNLPANETDTPQPLSPYGVTKITGELYLDFYYKYYGITYVSLRYSNVYGPRQSIKGEGGVISIFIQQALKGLNPTINGDGLQTRDFVYVKDVADANFISLSMDKPLKVNISTAKETTILELFDFVNAFFDNKFKKNFNPLPVKEQKRSVLSNNLAREKLGWTPKTSLADGLRQTYEYFLNLTKS